MSATALKEVSDASGLLEDFREAVADDLLLLASLNGSELDAAVIGNLKALAFPRHLGLRLGSERIQPVLAELADEVASWPVHPPQALLDELAVDFAAIYLNNTLASSPQESVWLDEEGLAWQQPMFEVREIYRAHGLQAENWRIRADDHLVNELLFMAQVVRNGGRGVEGLQDVTRFLDEHLQRWLMPFAERVANRCDTRFYGMLVLLTGLYCDELRDMLARILDEPRPTPEEIEARLKPNKVAEAVPVQFMPGMAPSW